MNNNTSDSIAETSKHSQMPSDSVRVSVIRSSQIIASVNRTSAVTGLLAAGASLLNSTAVEPFSEYLKTFEISLIVVTLTLIVLGLFLDRTLRRCPVCSTRITKATEDRLSCIECGTKLLSAWD